MLTYFDFFHLSVILLVYIMVYNISLFLFFWILFNQINYNNKTLYQFNLLKNHTTEVLSLTIILFSMAGVPPFLGFFTKLLILIILLHANLFIFYFSFFILLFFSLYFYLQNLRFLYSSVQKPTSTNFLYLERKSIYYFYTLFLLLFFLIFGFLFFEDLLLFFEWLLL